MESLPLLALSVTNKLKQIMNDDYDKMEEMVADYKLGLPLETESEDDPELDYQRSEMRVLVNSHKKTLDLVNPSFVNEFFN